MSFFGLEAGDLVFSGLDAYKRLWTAPELVSVRAILKRGLLVATIGQALAVPTALWITGHGSRFLKALLVATLLTPFFTSDAIRAYSWSRILSADGPLFPVLEYFKLIAYGQSLRFSEVSLVMVQISAVLPFGVLATFLVLEGYLKTIWHASSEFKVSAFQRLRKITLPLAAPGIVAGWLFQLVFASYSSVEEQYVGDSVNLREVVSSVLNQDMNAGSFLIFSLTVTMLFLVLLLGGLGLLSLFLWQRSPGALRALSGLERFRWPRKTWLPRLSRDHLLWRGVRRLNHLVASGIRRFPGVVAGLCLVLVLAPLAETIVSSITVRGEEGRVLSFAAMASIGHNPSLLAALSRSLLLALTVGCLCGILAPMVGLVWWRTRCSALAATVMVCSAALLPADSYCLALLQIARLFGIETGSLMLVAVGHIAWALPFCFATVLLTYSQVDTEVIRAGLELSTNEFRAWYQVVWKQTLHGVTASVLFGFLLSLNELQRGVYLGGGREFLATRVYGRLESGLLEGGKEIFALSALLTMASVAVVLPVLARIFRRTDAN